MSLTCKKASIVYKSFVRTYEYNNIKVLSLRIKYPIINIYNNHHAEMLINNQIAKEVNDYYRYVSKYLYNQSIQAYKDSLVNGFPFHAYDSVMEYNITYNDNCFLSLYYDKYEFTGGAHGSTLRASNTWELCQGTEIPLYCYFKSSMNYKRFIINELIKQASNNLKENPGIYFEDYKELIVKNFDEESYYLLPEGLSIYYQQYEIAPYSTGIVVLTIPYQTIGWKPNC